MISTWLRIVVIFLVFVCNAVDTVSAQQTYKKVKTSFSFVLVQSIVGTVKAVEDAADFQSSLGRHIKTTFNASIEEIETSPRSTWENVDVSYKLVTDLDSTYSLAVRDTMTNVIRIGEYVFSYNSISFKSKNGSLITKESWKETWYEIGHQILYAAIVAIVSISIFAVAVHFTCRWGKRRPATEGRYILNETPRTSRAMPNVDNPYLEEVAPDDGGTLKANESDAAGMNGKVHSNGEITSNDEKIEMKTLKEENSQADGKNSGTDNKGFENENSVFAKLVYSEYSVPAKHSHEFL
ncbi:uncharacterized protein LOC117123946 [Anneissia japonica]|uniref:uncharacterized protein LOC117123946 n=1 Tax=Anneissia japonica TaxID=1529436 RepID=UPI0014255954|nr:uncharacterized protein LOC117123946 [Anneissia japonica]